MNTKYLIKVMIIKNQTYFWIEIDFDWSFFRTGNTAADVLSYKIQILAEQKKTQNGAVVTSSKDCHK